MMSIREWYLSGVARQYRQTIVLSSFSTAEMNALISRHCFNHRGSWKLMSKTQGITTKKFTNEWQQFERVRAMNISSAVDQRFEQFSKRSWQRIKDSSSSGQLIFIPSYFDFVRL